MSEQMIALNLLIKSPINVGKTGREEGVEELMAMLRASGDKQFINPLLVRVVVTKGKGRGKKQEQYEVIGGGRRLDALQRLAGEGDVLGDHAVKCDLRTLTDSEARELSTMENSGHRPMHPADQFMAFSAMVEDGKAVDQIALRFGVPVQIVEKRLSLSRVSPPLIELFRDGDLVLEQMEALTVNPSHEDQERVIGAYGTELDPWQIRRFLTEDALRANNALVRFIGLAAYEEAGGVVDRDLFDDANTTYIRNRNLVEELALAKLAEVAAQVKEEGWAWVNTNLSVLDWTVREKYMKVAPADDTLDEVTQAEKDRLTAALDAIEAEWGDFDEVPEEVLAEEEGLRAQLVEIGNRPKGYTAEQRAECGVIVFIGQNGELSGLMGLVEKPKAEPVAETGLATIATSTKAEAAPAKKGPHSQRLVESLTKARTAAIQIELANNTLIALAATVHALLCAEDYSGGSCLTLKMGQTGSHVTTRNEDVLPATSALADRKAEVLVGLPGKRSDWFGYLTGLTVDQLLAILAVLAAQSVDTVEVQGSSVGDEEVGHGHRLAAALQIDHSKWFTPTASSYFNHVSKATVLDVVSQLKGVQAAQNIAGLKKGPLAVAAETLLADSGWVPEPFIAQIEPVAEEVIDPDAEEGEPGAEAEAERSESDVESLASAEEAELTDPLQDAA